MTAAPTNTWVSLIMSIIMAFSGLGLPFGTMMNTHTAPIDKEAFASQKVQQLMDYLDFAMQFELGTLYIAEPQGGESYGEQYWDKDMIPEGVDYIELDLSSVDGFIEFCERATSDESYLGGDFSKIDFSAVAGSRLKEDNALDIWYDAIQAVADNSDLVRKAIKADFDYGKLEYIEADIFGEKGLLNSFNLYEVIMQLIGAYGQDVRIMSDSHDMFYLAHCYEEEIGVCEHEGVGYHKDYTISRPLYDEDGNMVYDEYGWPVYEEYVEHIIPLTESEKSEHDADGYLVETFRKLMKAAVVNLGLSETAAEDFANSMDISKNRIYAIIPALVQELASISTNAYGDTIMHEIRQFFISTYGIRNIKAAFDADDVRLTGVREGMNGYDELLKYYANNYNDGDYALFDYTAVIDGATYKMFEASYKDDGSLVFYPYEETVSDKEIQGVINGLFDMHLGTVADDFTGIEGIYGETITADNGNLYYIDYDGIAYKLFGNFFPTSRAVEQAEIAALTEADLIINSNVVAVADNAITGLDDIAKVYYKNGYFYCLMNDGTWKCLADEQNDPFYNELDNALTNLCACVNPYFVYNVNKFDFVGVAEATGGSVLEQINDIAATIIDLGMTDKAKAELGWVPGDVANINDNLTKFVRFIANQFFSESFTKEINNMIDVFILDYKGIFDELSALFDVDYYNSEDFTLEKLLVDIVVPVYIETDTGIQFNTIEVPENIDTIEGLLTYMLAVAGDEVLEGFGYVDRFVKDGLLIEPADDEWFDLHLLPIHEVRFL